MSRKNIETRNRILACTWKLLEEEADHAVRMVDIAKSAGLTRQAVYLHFPTRAELLTATTKYIDEIKDVDARFSKIRSAESGTDRLEAFIEAWGNYIPEIYGVAKALMAMKDQDEEAAAAWNDRMQAVRHGCDAAIKQLAKDDDLTKDITKKQASELLWTLLSVRNWEQLVIDCGWSQKAYIKSIKKIASQSLISAK